MNNNNVGKGGKDSNNEERIPNKYKKLVTDINELEKDFKALTDTELRIKTFELQNEYKETKDLNSLISRSFALTREASIRTLGLRHFDVQLLAGLVLNDNKIAEMNTGEGKTLVATLPASLNALTKEGVHIITVNDYLANRDQVSMGQIYRFIGFDTGLIQSNMTSDERKVNYKADITYVTNSEVTFDYLRDYSITSFNDIVLRPKPFNYGIIDEVDSILIDEAQTPLIIATSVPNSTKDDKYSTAVDLISYLEINIDYETDEKNRNVILSESGNQMIEKLIDMRSLYDPNDPWMPYVKNALLAESCYIKNVNYMVQRNRVVIIDEFTGRPMPDRRWGDGLHQAVEAKEGVWLRPLTETTALITYQCFFRLYPKLCGMTGTAETSQLEFEEIYALSVEVIPTNRPMKRRDYDDVIYLNQSAKWQAVADYIYEINKDKRQPILVGTTTVKKSEMLSELLDQYGLSYQILNAKPDNARRESEIVAQAGKQRSITIATNMAGRGTDIILGGNINFQVERQLFKLIVPSRSKLISSFSNLKEIISLPFNSFKLFEKYKLGFLKTKVILSILWIAKRSGLLMKSVNKKLDLEILSSGLSTRSSNYNYISKTNKKFKFKTSKSRILDTLGFNILLAILVGDFYKNIKSVEKFINQKQILKINKNLKFVNINGRIELNADSKRDCSQKFFSILLILIRNNIFLELSNLRTLEILRENERILNPTISYQCAIRFLLNDLKYSIKNYYKRENTIVKELGGLFVIGTERNNSIRVDNQLRGRCGRQGDPGSSVFFLSVDDDLLRLFGGDSLKNLLKIIKPDGDFEDTQPIPETRFMKSNIDAAQKKIEENAYQQRKNLLKYDEILDFQRNIIYSDRKEILTLPSQPTILSFGEYVIADIFSDIASEEMDFNEGKKFFESLLASNIDSTLLNSTEFVPDDYDSFELESFFSYLFWMAYQERVDYFSVFSNGIDIFRDLEKSLALICLDFMWQEHIERMLELRDNVAWRVYAQKDPYSEYLREAFFAFTIYKDTFKLYTLYMLFRAIIV